MVLQQAILHILDFHSGVCVYSRQELDLADDTVGNYVEKHVERVCGDAAQKRGTFSPESAFLRDVTAFYDGEIDFVEWSVRTADALYQAMSAVDGIAPMDVLMVRFTQEGEPRLALLCLANKEAYTHLVADGGGVARNEIIRHRAILPGPSQKAEAYAVIMGDSPASFQVGFVDKERKVDGQEMCVLPQRLLQCSSEPSVKEVMKAVSRITEQVAQDYGLDPVEAVTHAKHYMAQNAEAVQCFSPVELGRRVFDQEPTIQDAFLEQVEAAQLPPRVRMEQPTVVRAARNHKIRTDTGIEITFPAEYFKNHEFIEFINRPDGTISIELKNIGKITNQ